MVSANLGIIYVQPGSYPFPVLAVSTSVTIIGQVARGISLVDDATFYQTPASLTKFSCQSSQGSLTGAANNVNITINSIWFEGCTNALISGTVTPVSITVLNCLFSSNVACVMKDCVTALVSMWHADQLRQLLRAASAV
jgi:hypothetical protein